MTVTVLVNISTVVPSLPVNVYCIWGFLICYFYGMNLKVDYLMFKQTIPKILTTSYS